MTSRTEDIVIRIGARSDKFQKEFAKAGKATKALESQLKTTAKLSATLFAGSAVAIGFANEAYKEQERIQNQVHQTIIATGGAAGITSQEVFNVASALQDVTTFGDESILTGQNIILTFKNISKDVFPEVTELALDMSQTMGTDMKSSAIQLGKALNDPITGITALTRVGVTFTEAQKAQIRTLQESGNLAGAQKIILNELKSEFGGAARAAAKGAGVQKQFTNSMGDFVEKVGKEFQPIINGAAAAGKRFFDVINDNPVLAKTAALILGVTTGTGALVSVLAVGALAFLNIRKAMIAANISANALKLGVRGLIGATGIGLLVIVATEVFNNWNSIWPKVQKVFALSAKSIIDIGSGLGKVLSGAFSLDLTLIKEGLKQAKEAVSMGFDETLQAVTAKTPEVGRSPSSENSEQDSKNAKELQAMADHQKKLAQVKAEEKEKARVAEAALDEELKLLNDEQLTALREEERALLIENHKTDTELRAELAKEEVELNRRKHKQFLRDEQKFGKAFALIKKAQNSEIFQGMKTAFGQLAELSQSHNKKLKAVGKVAAIGNMIIQGLQAAVNIYAGFSTIPIVGPSLGIGAAAASLAFTGEKIGRVKGAQRGGFADAVGLNLLPGTIPNFASGDRIPHMLERGEFIAPRSDAKATVNARAEQIAQQKLEEFEGQPSGAQGSPGLMKFVFEFREGLGRFITEIVEERTLIGV